ncbi:phage tail terminator protein [Lacrimispora sp.]|uniref:phage tail terminator protein n=1 Tax=Lacrimispora sp. TaxID=2719234 RepID=UPI0028AD5399|nr:minor capsid protein [Lacrimispora sp.]
MMLSLKDIRQYISCLAVAEDDNVYIGKLDNKKQKSIGVYSRLSTGSANIAIGGLECTTYDTKPVSLLIHWSKSKDETERAAYNLFEKLRSVSSLTIGDTPINFLRLMVPEPQDVGTDDDGVYEYVIWLDFIYERNR